MDQANILIIGGGVIGAAIAHAVSQRTQDVFLVEQNPKLGMATSTRNSGVIHSGIYYPKNSLKATLCIEGNRLMYDFCAKHNVPHRHTSSSRGRPRRTRPPRSEKKRRRQRRRKPPPHRPRRYSCPRTAHHRH